MSQANDLRTAIRDTVMPFLDWGYEERADDVVSQLMELIEPTIFDERRAAAEAMRERCARHLETFTHRKALMGAIANDLRKLPLNTPDDGRE